MEMKNFSVLIYTVIMNSVLNICAVLALISASVNAIASPIIVNTTNSNGRVTGGEPAFLGQFPWQAGIYFKDNYICGGVLVDKKVVLTSINCELSSASSDPDSFKVRVGMIGVLEGKSIDLLDVTEIPSTDSIMYQINLKVEIAISLDAYPINICHSKKIHTDMTRLVQLSGWALNDDAVQYNLQYTDHHIMDKGTCKTLLSGHNVDLENYHICTGIGLSGDPKGGCKWDVGSPLVAYDKNTYEPTLVGIVDHASCGSILSRHPTVYALTVDDKDEPIYGTRSKCYSDPWQ